MNTVERWGLFHAGIYLFLFFLPFPNFQFRHDFLLDLRFDFRDGVADHLGAHLLKLYFVFVMGGLYLDPLHFRFVLIEIIVI